ncbi:MAG: hypothetical protein A2Z94_05005 [Gallionellales bacterium GWA2_55_18]|nr:MAG: hypothetical protein A2Z94_05005 [Gallionellales bacterium GWA2_55_18]
MWFLGLLIGLVLGNIAGAGKGAFIGSILGLFCGLIYEQVRNRKQSLEERVAVLEKLVQQVSTQIATLNSAQQPAAQAKAESMSLSATQQPETVTPIASMPIDSPSTPPLIEPANPSNRPAFSHPIRPIDSLDKTQYQPDITSARSFLEEHEWLAKLFKGNILAKIGVIILFFGIASGLKLAIDMGLFPISVRLMLGALAAISMSIFGFHHAQKPEHRMFGQTLQGGGLGILYLLVYFMLARYQIIGETLAFILFTLIGVTCVLLAARQNVRSLAMLGISGAFLSPVMATSSGGSQITLFSYFLLLNTFIISVNWFKGWRELNISGFIFTLVIGMNWAFHSYQPSDFPISETFLILFFLLYSATPVLFNLFKAPGRLSWGDGMLLYGTPLAAATLQNHLLRGQDTTLAWNACAAGAYYMMLWWTIWRRPNEETIWLEKSLLGIAIGFFTLAIPLAFDAQLTSAFWTLEGFGVLYLGVKQDRFLARLSGSALQVLAGLYFFAHLHELSRALPVLNDRYVGCLIVVIAALASSLLLQRTANENANSEKTVALATRLKTSDFAVPFLYWGLLWWFAAGFSEINHFESSGYKMAVWLGPEGAHYLEKAIPYTYKMAEWLALCVFSFIFLEWLGTRRGWHAMRQPSALLLPVILVAALDGYQTRDHALYGIMSMLIPLAAFIHYWLLYRHDRDSVSAADPLRHAVAYWILIALVGSELAWVSEQLATDHTLWPWLAWGAAGALGILASLRGLQQDCWPFAQHRALYLDTLQAPVLLLLCVWLIYGNLTHSGQGSVLPYLPLLNPFDLIQLLSMFAIWKWLRTTQSTMLPIVYGIAFLWISAEAARLTHHWGGVPFEGHLLLVSSTLQAGLSMLWTSIAMGIMMYASHSKQRVLWFNGFGLLAIVGIKLMVIDLSNKGTALWTLSLICISLLIIATSYFSPAPPKKESLS